jgi:hypothetical protein
MQILFFGNMSRPHLLCIILCLRLPPHRYFQVKDSQLLVALACASDGL